MIPHRFHRVWAQQDSRDVIPAKYQGFWGDFRTLHPGWSFATWNSPPEWMRCREVYDQATTHAGRSDVMRYEIVAHEGGVYVDTDVEPLRPFDDLLLDDRPFVGWENDRLLCPTVIGGPAGHPALLALLDALPTWAREHRGRPPNQQTGPHFLTAVWRGRTDVRLLPRDAFYPVGWWERANLGGPYPPASYCVHHWEQGWDLAARARIDARQ